MYLFFDTETTGIPRNYKSPVTDLDNWPRLVQISWILQDEMGKALSDDSYIIKPKGFTIPIEASNIHHITNARALNEGVALRTALGTFNKTVGEAKYLVAHNVDIDEKIVGAELLRNHMTNKFAGKTSLCTMQSSIDLCAIQGPYGYKWPKLIELHRKLFNCDCDKAHQAKEDVAATARCFWEMKKRGLFNPVSALNQFS